MCIRDSLRAASFLIADGVIPSNDGRGYVLRRIIRRALRHAYKLEMKDPILSQLVTTLEEQMGETYPLLIKNSEFENYIYHIEWMISELLIFTKFSHLLSKSLKSSLKVAPLFCACSK